MERNEIIERAKSKYGEEYDYSLVEDAKTKDNVTIICKKHGRFTKRLYRFLNGSGCPKCSGKAKKTLDEFVLEANKVHNNFYSYSGSNYVNSHTKIRILCPHHGEFWQSPTNHLNGNGCPKCKAEKLSEEFASCMEDFIEKANKIHENKYDYSQARYINSITKTLINCPKHGEFWQTPQAHLSGRGCPYCNESKLEREIRKLLNENGIDYVYQWHLPWSKYYSLDFYIPSIKTGIECQGIQHFESGHFKNSSLNEVRKRDEYKLNSCNKNGISILYFSNNANDECIHNKDELIKRINERQKRNLYS